MLNGIFGQTRLLEKALDGAWLRNEVISHNIANADTPNYKKWALVLKKSLNQR